MIETTFKTARTIREYRVNYNFWDLIIPIGSVVSNKTACGNDDRYRFLQGTAEFAKQVTGLPDSTLAHCLKYYGLNIPADYCEPWSVEDAPLSPTADEAKAQTNGKPQQAEQPDNGVRWNHSPTTT